MSLTTLLLPSSLSRLHESLYKTSPLTKSIQFDYRRVTGAILYYYNNYNIVVSERGSGVME